MYHIKTTSTEAVSHERMTMGGGDKHISFLPSTNKWFDCDYHQKSNALLFLSIFKSVGWKHESSV